MKWEWNDPASTKDASNSVKRTGLHEGLGRRSCCGVQEEDG
jgi:hypothetical protein